MGTLVGTVLVLLTWLVCAAAVCALGLLPSIVIAGRRPLPVLLRTSLWWGLLAVTVFAYAINLVQPLRSARDRQGPARPDPR